MADHGRVQYNAIITCQFCSMFSMNIVQLCMQQRRIISVVYSKIVIGLFPHDEMRLFTFNPHSNTFNHLSSNTYCPPASNDMRPHQIQLPTFEWLILKEQRSHKLVHRFIYINYLSEHIRINDMWAQTVNVNFGRLECHLLVRLNIFHLAIASK